MKKNKIEMRGRKGLSEDGDGSVMIFCRVPVQLKNRIDALAQYERRTSSGFIRDALVYYINRGK